MLSVEGVAHEAGTGEESGEVREAFVVHGAGDATGPESGKHLVATNGRWPSLDLARCAPGAGGDGSAGAGGLRRADGPAFLQLALHVIQRGVAHVLAVDHVDDVLANVLGMVADALERTHHPQDVERAADRAWVFHHERDALALDRLVFLVDEPVLTGDVERRLDIHAGERVERGVHHLRYDTAEMLDLAVLVRRALHRGEPRGDVAHLLALIPDALEIGDGLDDGDDQPQVAGRRRPGRE